MPRKIEDPCEECQKKHLKCDDDKPTCGQCKRSKIDCCRIGKTKVKFRPGSSAFYDRKFPEDGIWVDIEKNAITFHDENTEIKKQYKVSKDSIAEQHNAGLATHMEVSWENESYPCEAGNRSELRTFSIDERTLTRRSRLNSTAQVPYSRAKRKSSLRENVTRSTQVLPTSPRELLPPLTLSTFEPGHNLIPRSFGSPIDLSVYHHTSGASVVPREPQFNKLSSPPPPYSSTTNIIPGSTTLDHDTYAGAPSPTRTNTRFGPFSNQQSPSDASISKRMVEIFRSLQIPEILLNDSEAAKLPEERFLSPSRWKEDFRWPNAGTTQQCVALFNYYKRTLGPWLDVGDPYSTFTRTVLEKARRCPPLLNAIFAAAALHLYHKFERSRGSRIPDHAGYNLPRLGRSTTFEYYCVTISYLQVLARPEEIKPDEDLLAAAVILRLHEELYSSIPSTEQMEVGKKALSLWTIQIRPIVQTPAPVQDYNFAVPGMYTRHRHLIDPYLHGYQHAAWRVALRQECSSALQNASDVSLPLEQFNILDGFDSTDVQIWTDRLLYHYAKVLRCCFNRAFHQQYNMLKDYQDTWSTLRVWEFQPYHYRSPDPSNSNLFPVYWYNSDVVALGWLFHYLARIMLEIHDPNIPRIGPGSAQARKTQQDNVQASLMHICGIASCCKESQPLMKIACGAIAAFGGMYVIVPEEREALLSLLQDLDQRHDFPTQNERSILTKEWTDNQ